MKSSVTEFITYVQDSCVIEPGDNNTIIIQKKLMLGILPTFATLMAEYAEENKYTKWEMLAAVENLVTNMSFQTIMNLSGALERKGSEGKLFFKRIEQGFLEQFEREIGNARLRIIEF